MFVVRSGLFVVVVKRVIRVLREYAPHSTAQSYYEGLAAQLEMGLPQIEEELKVTPPQRDFTVRALLVGGRWQTESPDNAEMDPRRLSGLTVQIDAPVFEAHFFPTAVRVVEAFSWAANRFDREIWPPLKDKRGKEKARARSALEDQFRFRLSCGLYSRWVQAWAESRN